ncbi:uncharacterized protein LOC131231639 isoform X2 [Magnolia sinica]|uniref:uncharacterized protein LOC131231639 isoform X2 n=1 Tax=Magnolia sinica TaxID=86752 RepID=UPI00265A840F|nr:uncharacterized protein LOC131231639 isoform X2 [Magnolia sinica]
MSDAKLRTSLIPDAMKSEQKTAKAEKEVDDSLDTFIGQAIGKVPFLSFSRDRESPIQWIQLLQTLDPQGANKLSKGPRVNNTIEGKERPLEHGSGLPGWPLLSPPKMSDAKLRTSLIPDAMKPEQKTAKAEKEVDDSLDTFIGQAIGKVPFLSFSRDRESPIQWIQLLQTLDPQGKERPLEHGNGMSSFVSEMKGVKESAPSKKCSGVPIKGTQSTSEQMQTLKIPEAVVALAQAAAKANVEPENACQVSKAGLPGWPLLSPPKVQKCDKCFREFCSSINYKRHICVHRQSLNINEDSLKNRDSLGAFWDKLSLDEAREIVSFKSVKLEEVAGSSIIRALMSFIRRPGSCSVPQIYVKAGAALLDVVQASPSRFPISSKELFSILDDASEKTFLCAGTDASIQNFVFDEAGKIGLETKNLIACTSFLVEQKLVKAWLADKDEEILRLKKLLMAEKEAARKRCLFCSRLINSDSCQFKTI